ncbi:MAG TPA: hypothetical protein VJU84_12330 [Pyrinomonadaceae bacterium]|nr:hypothetical protein [Pyrinomonadaceae bacterium]
MKRCPKCNRTYPDHNQKFCTLDGSSLVSADQGFDPNATILSTSNLANQPTPQTPTVDLNRTVASTAPPADPGRTAASSGSNATELLKSNTGPMGGATVVDRPAPASQPSAQSARLPQPPPHTAPASVPAKKSKLPLILGVLLVLLVLGVGAIAAAYFLVIRPRLEAAEPQREVVVNNNDTNPPTNDNANVATQPVAENAYVPPPGTVQFVNSSGNLDGRLAEHYFDFSFYYPNTWKKDPEAGVPGAVNYAKVERRIEPDFTQENFAVGWYTSKGTFAADESTFPDLAEKIGASLSKSFPGYRKVSEGPTRINSLDAYEFRFESEAKGTEKGDVKVWGRVIFLPPGVEGPSTGATLLMLATSLAPEVSGVEDVGVKGQMPVILESFRFGKDN